MWQQCVLSRIKRASRYTSSIRISRSSSSLRGCPLMRRCDAQCKYDICASSCRHIRSIVSRKQLYGPVKGLTTLRSSEKVGITPQVAINSSAFMQQQQQQQHTVVLPTRIQAQPLRQTAGSVVRAFSSSSGAAGSAASSASSSSSAAAEDQDHDQAKATRRLEEMEWLEVPETEQMDFVLDSGLPSQIRNFAIIAHVDHGKSTLADQMMLACGNISQDQQESGQVLDSLDVERERGITVKAQTASMFWKDPSSSENYLLNLIDCPGHVDFAYEVSRSLAACQGCLLLVDASQGVQAQTLQNFYMALEADLDIIPVMTKIDLSHTDFPRVLEQMQTALDFEPEEVLRCSAKSGEGVRELFPAIVDRISPPPVVNCAYNDRAIPFRALVFDSWYDVVRGVVCLVNIIDGTLRKGDRIASFHGQAEYDVQEVGLLRPTPMPTDVLRAGQVGYVIAGIKSVRDIRLGETLFCVGQDRSRRMPVAEKERVRAATVPLPGFQPAKSFVFAGLFPSDSGEFEELEKAIERLTLNDASVHVERTNSAALGTGYSCSFLGILSMEVFCQRLEDEFGAPVIISAPSVKYRVETHDGQSLVVTSPAKFPEGHLVKRAFEPRIKATVVLPVDLMGPILLLINEHRGEVLGVENLSDNRVIVTAHLPQAEILVDFNDRIQSISSGYASFDYEEAGEMEADLDRLQILLNGDPVDVLSVIVHRSRTQKVGRSVVDRLRKTIDRGAFEIVIQAAVGKKVVARARVAPYRKDVLTKAGKTVGGGDKSRKKKLLEKQKAGKKKMKSVGKVKLSNEAFLSVLQSRS